MPSPGHSRRIVPLSLTALVDRCDILAEGLDMPTLVRVTGVRGPGLTLN